MRSLFTDDAHGIYMTVADLTGADEIVKWIDGMTADKAWQHHKLTVYHIDFTGPDEASTLTYHTSHQTDVGDEGAVTLIVARYRDKLRRVDGRWKITEKIMEPGWMEQRRLASHRPSGHRPAAGAWHRLTSWPTWGSPARGRRDRPERRPAGRAPARR